MYVQCNCITCNKVFEAYVAYRPVYDDGGSVDSFEPVIEDECDACLQETIDSIIGDAGAAYYDSGQDLELPF